MSLELSSNDVEASGVDAELPLPSEFEPQTSNQAGMPEGHFEDSDLGTWGRHDDRTTFQKAVDFLPSFPFITWVPKYTQEKFTADVIASLIITVMLVPQSMAYAQLAGLDPIYGLYSSTIPLIVYPLFGTSHEMAIGPVAIISILNAEAVLAVSGVEAGSTRATELSHLLAFLVGMIQCVLGILHAGYITNFLSHPVLEGFISGAAIIIGTSQVSKLFGYKIPRSPYVFETWFNIFKNIKQIHWLTVGIGLESIVLLKVFQRLKQTKFTSENLQKLFKYLPGTLVVSKMFLCSGMPDFADIIMCYNH
jgi:MFS superfamily sulfate permease-like transporter